MSTNSISIAALCTFAAYIIGCISGWMAARPANWERDTRKEIESELKSLKKNLKRFIGDLESIIKENDEDD